MLDHFVEDGTTTTEAMDHHKFRKTLTSGAYPDLMNVVLVSFSAEVRPNGHVFDLQKVGASDPNTCI